MKICMDINVYIYIYIYIYICIYTCARLCVCVFIYTNDYIHKSGSTFHLIELEHLAQIREIEVLSPRSEKLGFILCLFRRAHINSKATFVNPLSMMSYKCGCGLCERASEDRPRTPATPPTVTMTPRAARVLRRESSASKLHQSTHVVKIDVFYTIRPLKMFPCTEVD